MSLDSENKLFKVEDDNNWLGDPDCDACLLLGEPCRKHPEPDYKHPSDRY